MKKQSNHKADIQNGNKGTQGQNKAHATNQGNRGGQMNTNRVNVSTKGTKK